MLTMEIGGVEYHLDPTAISAIRYRAKYGDSIVNHLSEAVTARQAEARLLRMCWLMIPADERPELAGFARSARKDNAFLEKALSARDALLDLDPRMPLSKTDDAEPFDEYNVLAIMAAARMDMGLIYELPILHLAGIASRCFDLQSSDAAENHKLSDDEFESLFPRRG